MDNRSYSVDGHRYSINVKNVKGNEYYVVNFRNSEGRAVGKSTGMKPHRDSIRQVEKKAEQIVSEYFADNAAPIDTPTAPAAPFPSVDTLSSGAFTQEQLRQLAAILSQTQPAANGMPFNDFAEDWLNRSRSDLANTTYVNYVGMLQKHIEPYFSGKMLSDIKPMHLQDYINQKKTEISVNTVSKHISLIGTIMEDAVRNELIQSNPVRKLKSFQKERPQNSFYNAEELTHLMSVSRGTEIEVPIFFAVMFGLRRSEIIGLRWSDVDFTNRTLTINGSVTRSCVDGRWIDTYDTTLKTNASHSTFSLNDSICEYLRELREHNMALISNTTDYEEFICVNAIGERLKLDYITHKFTKLLEQNGLRHIRFHDLRHSSLTLLAQHYSIKNVQGYARHANFKTTADVYCHFDSAATLKELDTLCSALNFG